MSDGRKWIKGKDGKLKLKTRIVPPMIYFIISYEKFTRWIYKLIPQSNICGIFIRI